MSTQLNPLEVEQRYQELLLSLSLPATPYQRLAAIASFLGFLGDAAAVFESHVIDVAERFRFCVPSLHASGYAPERLEQICSVIEAGFRRTSGAMETPGVKPGLDRMKIVCALAYAHVASWDEMFRVIGFPRPSGIDLARQPPGSAGLRAIEAVILPSDRSLRERVEEIRLVLAAGTDAHPHAAWFPVVERHAEAGMPHSGALRQVRARILGHSADGHESITPDVAVLGVDHTGSGLTTIPMQAVRAWLARCGVPDDVPMVGQVSFGGNHALHEGSSSDLAVAAVLACAVLRHNHERMQYAIREGVAFTGGLDADGVAQPVDDDTLCVKVEAAFYSPVEVLVVPRGQTERAESCVQDLRARYPRRILEIVGVRTLSDAFYDLRIIIPERASLLMHTVGVLWRRRSRTVALASTTVLLLIGAWYTLGRMDREPIRVEYEGDRLYVLNRYDAAIEEITVGEPTVTKWGLNSTSWDAQHGFAFADADRDGKKDLIYAQNTEPGSGGGSTELIAYSLEDHRRIWATSITGAYDFPERPDSRAGTFTINDIVAGDVDSDGVTDVYVASAHTPSFPGMVQRFDVQTGRMMQTYVNTGHIADIALADLDTDGIAELLVCGTNNAFNRAFLAMIDARSIEGCSPHTRAYDCASPATGRERAYAILPRSVLGTTLGVDQKGNGALHLRVDNTKGEVTVCVNDNKGHVYKTPVIVQIILNFAFDRAMVPLTVTAGDSYDRTATWAVEQNLLRELPSPLYLEGLKNEIRMWRLGVEVEPARP